MSEHEPVVLVDGTSGAHVPRIFARQYADGWTGIAAEDLKTLRGGLLSGDPTGYWETWDNMLNTARYVDQEGVTWQLWHDGDLFMIPEDYDMENML